MQVKILQIGGHAKMDSELSSSSLLAPASMIGRIESALEAVVDALENGRELRIAINSRRRNTRTGDQGNRYVRFPGSNAHEAQQFCQWRSMPGIEPPRLHFTARVLLILQLSHQALVTGTILTKRWQNLIDFYRHSLTFLGTFTINTKIYLTPKEPLTH